MTDSKFDSTMRWCHLAAMLAMLDPCLFSVSNEHNGSTERQGIAGGSSQPTLLALSPPALRRSAIVHHPQPD